MTQASPFRTAEQKDAERAAKRDAVLHASVRMFNDRGYHATSLDDVAASLGITKRTIYHYLPNKEQVLLECVQIGLDRLLTAAAEARASGGNGRAQLEVFLHQYAKIIMDDFGRCIIRTGEELLSSEGRKGFRATKRKIDDALRQLLRDAVADGSIAVVDVKLSAFALAGALNWLARWHDPDGALAREDIARRLVETLATGFLPRG